MFAHDLASLDVAFDSPRATDGPATGRCLIVVTPDAQRTMNTYLGASSLLGPDHLDLDVVRASKVTFLEGYLFDRDEAKAAYRVATDAAHEAGREVALSLSDGFCVDRHRADFLALITDGVDILFANEDEITRLYEVDDFDDGPRARCAAAARSPASPAARRARSSCPATRSTRSPPHPVARLVDTTGAGDLYAAGFLYGYTQGMPLSDCGRLGSHRRRRGDRPHRRPTRASRSPSSCTSSTPEALPCPPAPDDDLPGPGAGLDRRRPGAGHGRDLTELLYAVEDGGPGGDGGAGRAHASCSGPRWPSAPPACGARSGPARDRMNRATVRRAAAGVASWIQAASPTTGRHGSSIGRDARHRSEEFVADVGRGAGRGRRRSSRPPGTDAHAGPGLRRPPARVRPRGSWSRPATTPAADNGYKVYDAEGRADRRRPGRRTIAAAMTAAGRVPTSPSAGPATR